MGEDPALDDRVPFSRLSRSYDRRGMTRLPSLSDAGRRDRFGGREWWEAGKGPGRKRVEAGERSRPPLPAHSIWRRIFEAADEATAPGQSFLTIPWKNQVWVALRMRSALLD